MRPDLLTELVSRAVIMQMFSEVISVSRSEGTSRTVSFGPASAVMTELHQNKPDGVSKYQPSTIRKELNVAESLRVLQNVLMEKVAFPHVEVTKLR